MFFISSVERVLRNPYLLVEIVRHLGALNSTRYMLHLLEVSTHFRNPMVVREVYKSLRVILGLDTWTLRPFSERSRHEHVYCIDHDYVSGRRDVVRLCRLELMLQIDTINVSHWKVVNAAPFGRIRNVLLRNTLVRDVSALSNVYSLDLSHTAVKDVSALHSVHTLDISYTDVEDVSALTNVKVLRLSDRSLDTSTLTETHIVYV